MATSELMFFRHSPAIRQDYPELAAVAVHVSGVGKDADVEPLIARFTRIAEERLAGATEAEFPEIRAWRRAFSRMGLKPTQYRCAAEALLRRYRKEGVLPRIHPLIDLCNAASLAYAIPVAVLDVTRIDEGIEVRYARGDEEYLTFAGDVENPAAGEVVFADTGGRAHARRWTNRQSGYSAVGDTTADALIVAEAMHETGPEDIERLLAALTEALTAAWPGCSPQSAVLTRSSPQFTWKRR